MRYGRGERVEKRQNYNLLTWIHGLVAINTHLLGSQEQEQCLILLLQHKTL